MERRLLIRLIGVRFTHQFPGCHQIDMFRDTEEDIALYQAIDSVKKDSVNGCSCVQEECRGKCSRL